MDKYYKIFVSTVGTINANGGIVGPHPSVFKKCFSPMEARELEKTGKGLSKPSHTNLNVIEEASTNVTTETTTG